VVLVYELTFGEYRMLATLFASYLIPFIAVYSALSFAWRRRFRIPEGCCPKCGYDLRATPEKGGALLSRCPECGTAAGI
jgi:hypothetical protein